MIAHLADMDAMGDLALHLGSAACQIGASSICFDATSTMLVGYALLIAFAMVVAGWATACSPRSWGSW